MWAGEFLLWKKVLLNTDSRPIVLASPWVTWGRLFCYILLNFTSDCDPASAVWAASVQRDSYELYRQQCGSIVRLSKANVQHVKNRNLLSCAHAHTRVAYTSSAKWDRWLTAGRGTKLCVSSSGVMVQLMVLPCLNAVQYCINYNVCIIG